MNRILLLLASLLNIFVIFANETKQITVTFNENDFVCVRDSNDLIQIVSNDIQVFYENKQGELALPFVIVNVLIGKNNQYIGLKYSIDNNLVLKDVNMACVPQQVIGGNVDYAKSVNTNKLTKSQYPDTIVSYIGCQIVDGYKYLSFKVWPYSYYVETKSVFLNHKIDLMINLLSTNNSINKTNPERPSNGKTMRGIVEKIVVNKEDLSTLYPVVKNMSTDIIKSGTQYDYVIITRDSLKSSFEPLAKWKMIKGVRTKIVTIEEIDSIYYALTPQLRIKRCLQDYYTNFGLQYALLGGDEKIVPVQYCRAKCAALNKDILMPTDLFYCNFQEPLDWNANGNDSIGELSDEAVLTPEIFLTRAIIRTKEHTDVFVSKILNYEQNPPVEIWNNEILMCGSRLNNNYEGWAFDKGDLKYRNYISPYWSGSRKRFYDYNTNIDFNLEDYTANNLQTVFGMGFPFIDVVGHGNFHSWQINDNIYALQYSNVLAQQLQNNHPTIITSSACSTNAFDKWEPSLSEAFLRNPQSGVVAYFGCSDESLVSMGDKLGIAESYCADFYKSIFTDTAYCNYGRIIADIKLMRVPVANYSDMDRWMIYCMNPIGDPEMPIYKNTPKRFDNVDIGVLGNNLYLMLISENNYEVTISGKNSDGSDYYLRVGTEEYIQGIPNEATICITKPGYVPYVCYRKDDKVYIQNQTFTGRQIIDGANVIIGSHVFDGVNNKGVVVKSGTTEILMNNTTTITSDFGVERGATLIISGQ